MRRSAVFVPIALLFAALPHAVGDPARDPFTMALPSRDTKPPEGRVADPSTHSVTEQQGTAVHSIPIEVPAGRLGREPKLALNYSSAGALRGGVAVGWTLDVPVIERDPAFPMETRYRTSLGGGWQRLIPNTTDPGAGSKFRAEVDSTFTRYRLEGNTWIAAGSDGVVRTFQQGSAWRWNLISERDTFGNEVLYTYQLVSSNGFTEHQLSSISYSANAAAGIPAHAKVDLVYDSLAWCGGAAVGAATDYHFDFKRWSGSRRLLEIQTSVREGSGWRPARRYTLGYDTAELACTASTLRYLTRLDVTGYNPAGQPTASPPITFSYGAKRPTYATTMNLPSSMGGADQGFELGPTSMLIDMNGDGLVDRVDMLTGQRCRLEWKKGIAPGQFEATANGIDLPTARWREGDLPAEDEYCTLSGQKVIRAWTHGTESCSYETVTASYHLMDIDADARVDVITTLNEPYTGTAGGDFATLTGIAFQDNQQQQCRMGQRPDGQGGCTDICEFWEHYNPWTGQCEEPWQEGGNPGPGGDPTPDFEVCGMTPAPPERGPGDSFVWRAQRQVAGGGFVGMYEPELWVFHAPKPLTPNGSEATLDGVPRPNLPRLVDIDADGYLDVVATPQVWTGNGVIDAMPGQCVNGFCSLFVWPGHDFGTQGGAKTFGAVQYWPFQPFAAAPGTTYEAPISGGEQITVSTTVLLRDANGDGLPDMIVQQGSGPSISIAYNMGASFRAPVTMWLNTPVEQTQAEVAAGWEDRYLYSGQRAHVRRMVDLDGDGMLEHVTVSHGTSVTALSLQRLSHRVQGGGTFAESGQYPGAEYEPVEGLITAVGGHWRRMSDFTDVTGDGQPDLVTWNPAGGAAVRTDHGAETPARLLRTIDNGRGGVTRFEYANSNDATVVTLNGQPLSPRPVVKRVVVAPGFGQPEIKTTYRYATPVYGRNSPTDGDARGFLGFATITIDSSGQLGDDSGRVTKTFSYAGVGADWRGKLQSELSWVKEGSSHWPVKHVSFTYGSSTLAGSMATFGYVASSSERTCFAYSPDWICAIQPTNLKTTSETWLPWTPPGALAPAIVLNTYTIDSDGVTAPRYTWRVFAPRTGPTDFRILTTREDRGRLDPGFVQMARTDTVYNAAGLPEETRVYRDSTTYATTRRGYDPQTGVVTAVIQPNQVAGTHTGSQGFAYDGYKLRIVSRNNEAGQGYTESFDLATGAVLTRDGPSYRPACGGWCWLPDREEWTIDGFGRVVERRDSLDAADGGYLLTPVEWRTYVDNQLPNRRVVTRLRDTLTGATVVDEEHYDGNGRALKTIARRQSAGQCDPETRYTYDAGGALQRVDTPDPRVDSCATIPTTYGRDGIGRVISMTRPDGSSDLVTYSGLETYSEEVSIDGIGERTTAVKNMYGELTEVREDDNPLPGQLATTTYTYDALGRMQNIVDADGNPTALGYDWRGLRTSVTRGSRTWSYEYDWSGNLVSQTEPIPSGGTASQYTSTYLYDNVNRHYQYEPATRGMTPARRAELGIGTVTTSYGPWGVCCDKVGWVTLPFGQIAFEYDALGNVSREQRTFTVAGVATTQWVQQRHDALGNLQHVTWDDGTQWRYEHDNRGAISDVLWRDPSISAFVALASYERSAAGQPRVRTSDYVPQQRDWTYDVMGRVVYDHVWDNANEDQFHERNYGYDGFGELRTIGGHTNYQPIDANYSYDKRHRLTHAEGPSGYEATLMYSRGGNVLRADVGGALDSPGRYVDYSYGAVDPQAVDWLTDVYSSAVVGAFTYDRAGNMTSRELLGASHTYAWGADGLLHEAVGPEGTERYFFGPRADRLAAIGPDGIKLWFGASETHLTTSGGYLRRYHHIASGEAVARIENGNQVELQYADAMQNLVASVDRTGVVKAAFAYGAFGEIVHSYEAGNHRRRFNGKEHDRVSGLRHYGYRSYDPVTLRWANADPLYRVRPEQAWLEPQRANLYAFSINNPLRYLDPDGLNPEEESLVDEAVDEAVDEVLENCKYCREWVERYERYKRKAKRAKERAKDAINPPDQIEADPVPLHETGEKGDGVQNVLEPQDFAPKPPGPKPKPRRPRPVAPKPKPKPDDRGCTGCMCRPPPDIWPGDWPWPGSPRRDDDVAL